MTALVFVAVAAAAIGALVDRWAVVVPAAAAWPVFMLGLERGWWGNGVGDGWEASLVAGALLGGVGAALGVVARRSLRRPAELS
jgi:hypothetical protein